MGSYNSERRRGRILVLIAVALAVGTIAPVLLAQPVTYGGVTFPQGNSAFADRVVAYQEGSCVAEAFANPYAALGPPDCGGPGCNGCGGCNTCAASLGFRLSSIDNRAYLIVEFVDNRLVNVPGPDLFVYIINKRPAQVSISTDGNTYIPVGIANGWPTAIDIGPYVKPGQEFRFVRIQDVPGDEDRHPCPGPSVDAVGAMGPVRAAGTAMGSLELRPGGELALAATGAPKNLLIILDTSSSMDESFENSTKIAVAKQVLEDLVKTIPDGTNVALRIFGGCNVSQLIVPMGPINRATLSAKIQTIEAGGSTPIAYALEQAKNDFANVSGPDLILLVTDGIETCHGNPVKAAENLISSGYNLKIHVVGFDIGEGALASKTRAQLKQIAAVTNGVYFDARNSSELRQALALPTQLTYHVYDQAGTEVFTGNINQPAPKLPAGSYRVVIDTVPPTVVNNVVVQSQQTTTITINRADGGYKAQINAP